MDTKVSQITVEELREMIGEVVEEKLRDIFRDSKEDLELKEDLVKLLDRQTTRVNNGDRGEAFEDVMSRLGLN